MISKKWFPYETKNKPQNKSCFFNKKPPENNSPTRAVIEDDGWQITAPRQHAIEPQLQSPLPSNPDNPLVSNQGTTHLHSTETLPTADKIQALKSNDEAKEYHI